MIEILKKLGLPIDASAHGGDIDLVIGAVHVLMAALFIGWGAFFIYTLFRFRRSKNPKASYEGVSGHGSAYVEALVAFVEAVILIGFAIPFWADRVGDFPAEADSTVVRVIAQQYAWNIHYPGEDGLFGETDPTLVSSDNAIGLDYDDPDADDDLVTLNDMRVPVGKDVIVHLSSMDVIHSFFLPEMRVKQDAIPGMSIPVHFKPDVTTAAMREQARIEGLFGLDYDLSEHNFTIQCAQLCGIGHYRMKGTLTILTEEEFQSWFEEEREYLMVGEEDYFFEDEGEYEDEGDFEGEFEDDQGDEEIEEEGSP